MESGVVNVDCINLFDYGLHYVIAPKVVDRKVGEALLLLQPLSGVMGKEMYQALRAAGLRDIDRVAEVRKFYPNGQPRDEEWQVEGRRGVGSLVLEHMIRDARQQGGKALWVETSSLSMQQFLRKKEFQQAHYDLGVGHYYRLL